MLPVQPILANPWRVTPSHALSRLAEFEAEIPRLHPEAKLDYRGRRVDASSVTAYLRSERHRFAEIASEMPAPREGSNRLLDVGIGYGFLTALLAEDGWKCEGLDVEENIPVYGAFAKSHGIPIHAGKLGRANLPFHEATFHAVILSEVLEHLRLSPHLVFHRIHHILHRHGWLLLTTPNIARLTNVAKLAMGRNVLEEFPEDMESDNVTERLTHIREYTMDELTGSLRRCGFMIRRAWFSSCMERDRPHRAITALVPRWRGSLMVLAEKAT